MKPNFVRRCLTTLMGHCYEIGYIPFVCNPKKIKTFDTINIDFPPRSNLPCALLLPSSKVIILIIIIIEDIFYAHTNLPLTTHTFFYIRMS